MSWFDNYILRNRFFAVRTVGRVLQQMWVFSVPVLFWCSMIALACGFIIGSCIGVGALTAALGWIEGAQIFSVIATGVFELVVLIMSGIHVAENYHKYELQYYTEKREFLKGLGADVTIYDEKHEYHRRKS